MEGEGAGGVDWVAGVEGVVPGGLVSLGFYTSLCIFCFACFTVFFGFGDIGSEREGGETYCTPVK